MSEHELLHRQGAQRDGHVEWPYWYTLDDSMVTCPICKITVVMGPKSEKLNQRLREYTRLLIAYNDFKAALSCTSELLDEGLYETRSESRLLINALNASAIIAYARPFTKSRGKYASATISGNVLGVLSEDEREIHDQVLRDRNTLVGHSDADSLGAYPGKVKLGRKEVVIPMNVDASSVTLTKEAMQNMHRACVKLQDEVMRRRMELEPLLLPYLPDLTPKA